MEKRRYKRNELNATIQHPMVESLSDFQKMKSFELMYINAWNNKALQNQVVNRKQSQIGSVFCNSSVTIIGDYCCRLLRSL